MNAITSMNFKSNTINTFTMQIGPDLARAILAMSQGNRAIREHWVEVLMGIIRRGEWTLHHQGIAFDINGVFIDGHHRMTAIIRAGCVVPVRVTVGLPLLAVEAVDQGVRRSLADVMGMDKRTVEALRLATTIARGSSRVTVQQVNTIAAGPLTGVLDAILTYCGTTRKYFSAAPMRLAAALTILDGGSKSMVLAQYAALCHLNFDDMTPCAKGLVRQVQSGLSRAGDTRETLARGFRVFDSARANVTRVQVSEDDVTASTELARRLILRSVGEQMDEPVAAARPKTPRLVVPAKAGGRAATTLAA